MRRKDAAQKAIENQRYLVSRLKREIFGVDKTYRSRYISEFNSEFREYRRIVSLQAVIDRAAEAEIIYFGDYHPMDSSQDLALGFLRALAERGTKLVLALEMLYVGDQEHLDRWMQGKMKEEDFLEAIDYSSEWGFNWVSFKRFFELAKNPFVPIFGIDSHPRDNLRSIRKRDRLAAARIATIRRFFPEHSIFVVVGESHVARNHLPREVRAAMGREISDLVIVQNIDEIYWKLLEKGRNDAEAVEIDSSRFCIITGSPLRKYEAYREMLNVWSDKIESDRCRDFFHDAAVSVMRILDRGRESGSTKAEFPEVVFRKTYKAFCSYLRFHRVKNEDIEELLERIRCDGMVFYAYLNKLLALTYDGSAAIREAARFAASVIRKNISSKEGDALDMMDSFYRRILDEALVLFLALSIDPAADSSHGAGVALDTGKSTSLHRKGTLSQRELERIVELLDYCEEREKNCRTLPRMTKRLKLVYSLPPRIRLYIERALGWRLASALEEAVRKGKIGTEEATGIVFRDLDRHREATKAYFYLVHRSAATKIKSKTFLPELPSKNSSRSVFV